MQWSDIQFKPSARTLRQFAGLWLLLFAFLAFVQGFLRHHPAAAAVLGILAVVIGFPGLAKPTVIRPVYVGAMILAFPIGWTVSKLLLTCLLFGIFTPIAFMFRLMGRDALCRRHRSAVQSYWAPKIMPADPHSYLRPF